MKATINGITVEGTPQEIAEYQRLSAEKTENKPKVTEEFIEYIRKKVNPKPWDCTGTGNADYIYQGRLTSWNDKTIFTEAIGKYGEI